MKLICEVITLVKCLNSNGYEAQLIFKKAYADAEIVKVLEHCTTAAALDAVRACGPTVAGMCPFPLSR